MYVEASGGSQARVIVNVVVVVFLVIGMFMVLQYFHFIYLRDVPVIGGWLMDVYEQIFGIPKVLILHGEDSIGDWTELRSVLSHHLFFYSEDIDVDKYGAGLGEKLKEFGLVIVEDARRLDKDKLINLDDYVKGGGNLIWVGDAGTIGKVEFKDEVIATQTGWLRDIVCIDKETLLRCDCKSVKNGSSCKFLPEKAEQIQEDFSEVLGVRFIENIEVDNPRLEILDSRNWVVSGVNKSYEIKGVYRISRVSNEYTTALVANVNITKKKAYPAIVVNDNPGSSGMVVYFAYPPEKTPEILLPLVRRMRY